MSNYEYMKDLINAMSGAGENILAVNKSYLEFMGSLEGGVFLSQLIFFSDKSKRTDGYFYKTYDEWQAHTYLSEYSVRKQTKILVNKGVLETKLMKANGSPTVHYKFHIDTFIPLFTSFLKKRRMETEKINHDSEISQNPSLNIPVSLTEITTENTTDININNDKQQQREQQLAKINPFQFYTNNGFGLTMDDITRDEINMWCDDLSDELVVLAMQIAIEQNAVRWAYVKRILNSWYQKQIKTVEQVKASEIQRDQQKGAHLNGRGTYRQDASHQRESGTTKTDAEKRLQENNARLEKFIQLEGH